MSGKRRILFVSQYRPNPNGSGGLQRRYSTFSALSKVADVDLLTLGRDPYHGADDELYLASLSNPPIPPASLPMIDRTLVRVLQGYIEGGYPLNAPDRAVLARRIEAGDYDLIYANRAVVADRLLSAMKGMRAAPKVMTDLDDILSDVIRADVRTRGRSIGVQSMIGRMIEGRLAYRAERRVIRASAVSFVCSESDRIKLTERYPAADVRVLPNISRAEPLPPPPYPDELRLLFVGALDYDPNSEGLGWFLSEIWPAVKSRFGSKASLTVAGRGSEELIRPLAGHPDVAFHLNVPAIEPYYRAASVAIIPIRYGGGTSIKTIEAMATGRPVLSTASGVRGLGVVEGEHYLGFEDAEAFVAACERLMTDRAGSAAMVAAAQRFHQQHFSQTAVDAIIAGLV